jgi:putative peptidoglycan lipid II flippase
MSIATFISRILGFVRDMVLAAYLGATGYSDAFYVAFRIPNLLRELFAEGSMSSAFIPVLSEYQVKEGDEGAKRLARIVFTFVIVVVGAICVAGIIFAPAIVSAIAPGFLKDPGKFSLTVLLARIMFPFLLMVSLAAIVMGVLNTRGVFFVPALAPAVLNVTMIIIVPLLAGYSATTAAAAGVLCGGFMQFAFQVPSYFKRGFDFRPDAHFRDPGLKKISFLILPATLALAVAQINIVVSNILASFLPAGSITYLFYSMRLIHFPIGIFGVAMGLAVLPALSEHALKKDFDALRDNFSFALRVLFFLTLPAMAGLIALRVPIVSTLFFRGRFDYNAVLGTSSALLFYSTGIWAMVGVRVLASTFYSMQDTRSPVRSAVAALASNLVLSFLLMGPMRHNGLAFANALASMLNFSLLFYMLRRKLGRVDGRRIARSFLKSALASIIMGVTGFWLLRSDIWSRAGLHAEKWLRMGGVITLSAGIYIIISYILGSPELEFLAGAIKRRFISFPVKDENKSS